MYIIQKWYLCHNAIISIFTNSAPCTHLNEKVYITPAGNDTLKNYFERWGDKKAIHTLTATNITFLILTKKITYWMLLYVIFQYYLSTRVHHFHRFPKNIHRDILTYISRVIYIKKKKNNFYLPGYIFHRFSFSCDTLFQYMYREFFNTPIYNSLGS